ncbi:ras association domain-containing protein 5 isoform X2 [Rhineura floridana]|uniref:ras association domain-containing protein 5 isoform X2 n=1 Tax=Rhineura floridana TaxID=261503 RepID=UPI002AC83330|nr:ras association domain-containing protein 5 isoform X2 [Rhineura floridana]
MAMASPAIGQYPYPLLLDKEQQLFLQSLSANERKKILKRSASNDMKQQPPRLRQSQPPHTEGVVSQRSAEEEDCDGDEPLNGKAKPAAGALRFAACGRHLGSAAGAERAVPPGGPAAADTAQTQPGACELLLGAPILPGDDEAAAAIVANFAPRQNPTSPGAAVQPLRSGLQHHPHHHHRLRLRSGAPRLLPDVRTIFEQPRDPRVREEKGEGHRFEAFALWKGWCDLCGEAVQQRALRCANCKYTCHQECRNLIQLDCSQQEGQTCNKTSPENTLTQNYSQNVTKTVEEEKPKAPTIQELKEKIDNYNSKVNNCLLMKLNDDGTYTGFIKVHLKLRRPVTVPAGIRPQSIYDALKEVNLANMTEKRTSFYLPLDAIKQLHISSTTTVNEVIQGLLKKFMVVDNPQKFALFKQMQKDGQVLSQKLSVTEFPLYLRLLAGPDTDILSFVLKENETGEVEWDDFSIPELQNFLVILEREEKDKIQQVQKKYDRFKQRLQEALKEANGKPG